VRALEKQEAKSDEELFQDWLKGGRDSFDNLLARYQGRLYKVILGWTKNPHLSQDLFQETWVRVIEHKGDFDPGRKFSSWIFSIALNLTRDHWRREKRNRTEIDSGQIDLASGGADQSETLSEQEQMKELEAALGQLSEIEREVFMLRHFGALSFKEIADLLGINLNTALGRMHQALGRLKKIMGVEE
jgi:RNA polymerase sigma factor (sigma-70 family)